MLYLEWLPSNASVGCRCPAVPDIPLQQCLGHPMKRQGGKSVPICPSHPQRQGWSSATMPGVHIQLLGSPRFQRVLFWGARLPHHDALSP